MKPKELPAAVEPASTPHAFCGVLLLRDKKPNVIRFSHLWVLEYLETESMNKHWDIIDAQRLVMGLVYRYYSARTLMNQLPFIPTLLATGSAIVGSIKT